MQALAAIASFKLAGDKETSAAEAEWHELTQLIEHDRKQKARPLYFSSWCQGHITHLITLMCTYCMHSSL